MPTLEEIKKRKQYITYANQTEEKYGLPKNILVGVMGAESNFNPNAVSHVGAKGLMQFMKATAQEYGINPLNPSESINAAGKYLQSSYKKFGNWEDALRSYNMGVGGLQKVKAGKKSLPKETKDYVGRVYKYAEIKYEDPSYVNTSPQGNNQTQETVTPTLNYFGIQKETPTFASVPDSVEKEDTTEKIDKDVAEVEQKTKEYNFLEELQKEDYSHLQPEQVAQQQTVPQVDFNQQFEQVSQFIDEPLVAQSGGMINFYKEYINSPNYKKRLVTQGYKNPNSTINSRTKSVGSTSLTSKNGFGSQYFPSTKSINIDNNQLKNQNLPKDSTTAHEYSHAAGSMMLGYNGIVNLNLALNNKEMLLLNSKNQYNNIDTSYDSKLSMDKKIEIDHDKLPGEAKANIDALRYKLKKAGIYDTGTQDFNQNLLNKAKKLYSKDLIINRNFKAFKDKDLIYIMNNIAQNERHTDDTTQVAQQGLTWQEKLANRPKKLQQGGEFSENELAFLSEIAIKDNNGYWDKNNQGKVVEIQGGNISMENVDQDLIGIGIDKKGKKTEQKIMKAGKNYNFDKAIKVIEIPLFKK